MNHIDLEELERVSDYSIALIDEIARDIGLLSRNLGSDDNNLNEINRKIDVARIKGVNVDNLDKQVQEFRISLFRRDVKNKIDELIGSGNEDSLNINKIEEEYEGLKEEKNIDFLALEELMKDLSDESIRARIKHMISDIKNSGGTSVYTIDRIAHEISKAKEKNINVDAVEEMLFADDIEEMLLAA